MLCSNACTLYSASSKNINRAIKTKGLYMHVLRVSGFRHFGIKILFGLVIVTSVFTMSILSRHNTANASPGSPNVPETPTVIYAENFQNTSATGPVLLTNYNGLESMTYTANAAWLTNCNGEVLSFNTPDNEFANSNCSVGNGGANSGTNLTGAYDQVRRMAYAMGVLDGVADPATNKALTAYTDYGNLWADPGADLVQFETEGSVDLAGGIRRFVISQLDTASVNCTFDGTVQAQHVFYLLDGGTPRRINQDPINVCNHPNSETFTPPPLGSNGSGSTSSNEVLAARIFTDRAVLTNNTSVGLRMINEEGGGYGNDNALDNIQIADASPKLDKSFSPDVVPTGGTSRMIFTVTNTNDLLEKAGWSFTDTLPTSLVVANEPNIVTTCQNGEIVVSQDKKQVSYSGDSAAGQTSCTLTVSVTSKTANTYVNKPANISAIVGLQLPADAEITFTPGTPESGVSNNNKILPIAFVMVFVTAALAIIWRRKLHKA